MPEYDPVRDDDTKIISVASLAKAKEADAVVLPDGTRPVKMGSGVITGILGEGGMSVIYEIWNEQLGVKRAVKLLRPNSSKESRVRFEQEMKVTAQLDHPNIIDIHAVGEWNGLPYIEMEKVHGLSLEELIARQGALRVIHIEEGDPLGKLCVVRISRGERAAPGIDIGADMHGRFCA